MFTHDGEVLLIKNFYLDKLQQEAKGKLISGVSDLFKNQLDKLLLTKAQKGDYLIKMDGQLFRNESLYNTNAFESSLDIDHKTNSKTLKLISKRGIKLTALRFLSNLSNIFDIKEVFDFATQGDIDDSQPAPLLFGPLTVISEVAGLHILAHKQEQDAILDYERHQMFLYNKSKGAKNIRNFVFQYGDKINYDSLIVSKQAAVELLKGNIKTINQLIEYDNKRSIRYRPILVVYKFEKMENRENTYKQIVESIFINE